MRASQPGEEIRGFGYGVGLLGRGLALYARSPALLLLGVIPVLVTAALFTVALVVLLFFLGDLAAAATWFAAGWPDAGRVLARVLAGIAIVGGALLVGAVTFTAVTLAIGDPFYDRISHRVEQWCGGVSGEVELGFWRGLRESLADSLRVVVLTALIGAGLLLAGFLPVLGQTVVPVVGAVAAGWFLAVELVGFAFSRRGLRLRDRWRALRGRRAAALGFGVAVFGCFLVPGGVVLVMPAAVAGGTLLARSALGLPDRPPAARPSNAPGAASG